MEKAVFFDLDGTLTDSGQGIINCATLALEHFGLPVPSYGEMGAFVGPPLDETFRKFGVPADRTQEAIEVFRGRYLQEGKYENFPYPGIREALEALKAQGWLLCVATSKPETTAVDILEHFDLANYFTIIAGATMDGSRSSKSSVLAYLLAQLDRPERIVMVGDTVFDVLGAKAHGIPTVGVAWGYGDVAGMKDAGAMAIAKDREDLVRILNA